MGCMKKPSLRAGWRNLVNISLIFAIIISFMLFTVFPLVYVLSFEDGWHEKNLAARGLEEPCASFPDFFDYHQFHVIYCVSSRLFSFFRRIFDSRFTWIHF